MRSAPKLDNNYAIKNDSPIWEQIFPIVEPNELTLYIVYILIRKIVLIIEILSILEHRYGIISALQKGSYLYCSHNDVQFHGLTSMYTMHNFEVIVNNPRKDFIIPSRPIFISLGVRM